MANEKLDYRISKSLNLDEIRAFITNQLTYNVVSIEQQWRHVTARLEREGREYFFKMASTTDIATRTRNEVSWNRQLGSLIDEQIFAIPEIITEGEIDGKYFYISEFVAGEPVLALAGQDTTTLSQNLERIARINSALLNLELPADFELLKDVGDLHKLEEKLQGYVRLNQGWANELINSGIEVDLSPNLELLSDSMEIYKLSLNHGDFTPWHILIQEGTNQLYLIDAEHSSEFTPLYYDVAYFYHRVYTKVCHPGVAKAYMQLIQNHLLPIHKNDFKTQFKAILGSRIIGGLWDIRESQSELEMHLKLQEEWINDTFID